MRYLILILPALPVNAADVINNQDGSVTIQMSPQEMNECAKKGGCVIISVQDVQEISKEAAAYMCGKTI